MYLETFYKDDMFDFLISPIYLWFNLSCFKYLNMHKNLSVRKLLKTILLISKNSYFTYIAENLRYVYVHLAINQIRHATLPWEA